MTPEWAKTAAREIAFALNRSHCTGDEIHTLTHALLDNASDLGDIAEAWAEIVGPIITETHKATRKGITCSTCIREGKTCQVNIGPTTGMSYGMSSQFYDEQGNRHSHSIDTWQINYWCSNGHSWSRGGRLGCGSCDWATRENVK